MSGPQAILRRYKISGSCGGACCRKFHFPFSKNALRLRALQGKEANRSKDEYRKIADMVIPLGRGLFSQNMKGVYKERHEQHRNSWDDRELFYFTCKHLNQKTMLCDNYAARPEVCKIHPTETVNSWINDGKYHLTDPEHVCPYRECGLTIKEHPWDKFLRAFLYGLNGPPRVRPGSPYYRWKAPLKDRIRWWFQKHIWMPKKQYLKSAMEEF